MATPHGPDIPFNKPFFIGKELDYIAEAVSSGHLAGDGGFTRRCQDWMEQHFHAKKVLLTHSCTAALEMGALLANVEAGDEVILPSYTFVSTANAFVLRGAKPVFVDIRPDTLNMDEALVEAAITERTKAIVPVHYAGVACEMDALSALAAKHGLMMIEDAAQGVNATWKGRYLGTIGAVGAYSFHETKNFISGEGGALVINDEDLIERAEILREKGTNRSQFFRGQVDKYTWVDVGSSFLPSELIAAFLFAQLENSDEITRRRVAICDRYQEALTDLEADGLCRLPVCPDGCVGNGHMFYLICDSGEERDRMLSHMRAAGVLGVFHYVPLHTSPVGRRFGYREGDLPLTEDLSERLVRLPCYYSLSEAEQQNVISTVRSFWHG